MINQQQILKRFTLVFIILITGFLVIVIRLIDIQYAQGDYYRGLSEQLTIKIDTIQANRGNIFSSDGSLLATSMVQYEIRMDAETIDPITFEKHIGVLSDSLYSMLGKNSTYWEKKMRNAKREGNRYLFITRNIGHNDYLRIRSFPIYELGMFKGGFISEQSTVRMHPLGGVAKRTIGYGNHAGKPGIEGAYDGYLKGQIGWRKKQKIAQGQWRPINDKNLKDPEDGKDIVTSIDINIQDIAHHSLLKQLKKYDAEHGCAVVMETATGKIKAISNLGKGTGGDYYEKRNYAVYESHEPGSTFKLMSMVAALEEGAIDTSTVVNTGNGKFEIYGRFIHDSKRGGHGKISMARAFEVSSNIAFASIIDEKFSAKPDKFIKRLKKMHLNEKIGLQIKGEGSPMIPDSKHALWSKNALPSISYGYNLRLTPLQTLTFYNAIANKGIMVKPRFITAIKENNQNLKTYGKSIIDDEICSYKTAMQAQKLLENAVKRGTGEGLYDKKISLAGKTGTSRVDYNDYEKWLKDKKYISSFTGYFPAESPQYSCIVVIHKPSVSKGYYGIDVSGPVFKDIAQKIYTSNHEVVEVTEKAKCSNNTAKSYEKFVIKSRNTRKKIPNLIGMELMDAMPLLENIGLRVSYSGSGKVEKQSLEVGSKVVKGQIIRLTLG
jgi:cell division protein FtsI (penicillin-binding protein 3)